MQVVGTYYFGSWAALDNFGVGSYDCFGNIDLDGDLDDDLVVVDDGCLFEVDDVFH